MDSVTSFFEEPRFSIGGNSLRDLYEWKKLPNIKDKRVTKARFFDNYGYCVDLGDGKRESIVGPNAYARTLQYLRGLK